MKNIFKNIILLSLFGIFIITPVLSFYVSSLETDDATLKQSIKKLKKKEKELKGDIDFVKKHSTIYSQYLQNKAVASHEKVVVLSSFDDFKRRHHLNKLSWQFAPEKIVSPSKGPMMNFPVSSTKIELKFRTTTDKEAFDFVKSVENETTGFVILKSLMLRKNNIPIKQAISRIEKGRDVSIINGELTLLWKTLPQQSKTKNNNVRRR
jgi:hypothetical protein